MRAINWLRRVKRQWTCFDSRLNINCRPQQTGLTNDGSPLFASDQPLDFEISSRYTQDFLLAATLYTRPSFRGPFRATVHLRSGSTSLEIPLNCRPDWRGRGLRLAQFDSGKAARSGGRTKLLFYFSGEHAHEIRIGELKLERDPRWQLRRGVQGVSFPRSGHHMVSDLLCGYFGTSFQYCEKYTLCNMRFCPNAATHLQKNHDHEFDLPTNEDREYLVQYRHPLPSIMSQYEHLLKLDPRAAVQDSPRNWEEFAIGAAEDWRRFVQKWVLSNRNPRTLMVAYEQVMRDPAAELARLRVFSPPTRRWTWTVSDESSRKTAWLRDVHPASFAISIPSSPNGLKAP